ncbi:MAG: aldo/keto reductase [Candidatus Njordarchaeia archaeon]
MGEVEYTKLGKTRIKISKIGIGTWQWGSKGWGYRTQYTYEDLKEAYKTAVEGGINFFDTAEFYGGGESEKILGKLAKENRENIVIATKVWPTHLSYKGVINSLNKSLERLEIEYVDLLYVHWPNPIVPMASTARAFKKLHEEEKIRAIGVSNFNLKRMIKFNQLVNGKLSANQVKYSLLKRDVEKDLLKYCLENNITLVAYSPLDQGAISGKYDEKNLPKDKWRRINTVFTKKNMRKIKPLIQLLEEIAEQHGVKPVNIALRYLIQKGAVPIVGVKKREHVESLLETFEFNLKKEEIELIKKQLNSIKITKMGALPEMIIRLIKG